MKPIVIHLSLGEWLLLWDTVVHKIKHPRQKRVFRISWNLYRRHVKRGSWEPYTLGRHVRHLYLKRYLAHWPRQHVRPGQWRH